jgi:hypothetical protein
VAIAEHLWCNVQVEWTAGTQLKNNTPDGRIPRAPTTTPKDGPHPSLQLPRKRKAISQAHCVLIFHSKKAQSPPALPGIVLLFNQSSLFFALKLPEMKFAQQPKSKEQALQRACSPLMDRPGTQNTIQSVSS